jgi:hypothetical protein
LCGEREQRLNYEIGGAGLKEEKPATVLRKPLMEMRLAKRQKKKSKENESGNLHEVDRRAR